MIVLSLAALEALGMDLYRRNKPEKQPFAHLIIDDKNIPSGKFSFKWILSMQLQIYSTVKYMKIVQQYQQQTGISEVAFYNENKLNALKDLRCSRGNSKRAIAPFCLR